MRSLRNPGGESRTRNTREASAGQEVCEAERNPTDLKVVTVPCSRLPWASRVSHRASHLDRRLRLVFPQRPPTTGRPCCARGVDERTRHPGQEAADCRVGAPAHDRPVQPGAGRAGLWPVRPGQGERGGLVPGRDKHQAGHRGRERLAVSCDGFPLQRGMGAVICSRQVVQTDSGPAGDLAGEWNGSWNDVAGNPSAVGAVSAITRVICAANADSG